MAVVVTITPHGQPTDLQVDGVSVAAGLGLKTSKLIIEPGCSPLLCLTVAVDEITVKAPDAPLRTEAGAWVAEEFMRGFGPINMDSML